MVDEPVIASLSDEYSPTVTQEAIENTHVVSQKLSESHAKCLSIAIQVSSCKTSKKSFLGGLG